MSAALADEEVGYWHASLAKTCCRVECMRPYPQMSLLDLGSLQISSLGAEQLHLLCQLSSFCLLALPALAKPGQTSSTQQFTLEHHAEQSEFKQMILQLAVDNWQALTPSEAAAGSVHCWPEGPTPLHQ